MSSMIESLRAKLLLWYTLIIALIVLTLAVDGAVVLVGQDLSEAQGQVVALAERVGATGVAVLLLSLAGGWFLTSRALAPTSRISRAATAMASGDLSARIPIKGTENEFEH